MTPSQAQTEIEKLRKELSYHSYRYYVLDDPEISDAEHDRMFRKLRAGKKNLKKDIDFVEKYG
jgi:DNA ligase (NAD+)